MIKEAFISKAQLFQPILCITCSFWKRLQKSILNASARIVSNYFKCCLQGYWQVSGPDKQRKMGAVLHRRQGVRRQECRVLLQHTCGMVCIESLVTVTCHIHSNTIHSSCFHIAVSTCPTDVRPLSHTQQIEVQLVHVHLEWIADWFVHDTLSIFVLHML